jgi:hypothetical protein
MKRLVQGLDSCLVSTIFFIVTIKRKISSNAI